MEEEENVVQDNTKKYIDEIAKLKKETVSIEDYKKLEAENKNLLNSIVNDLNPKKEEDKEVADINELRKRLRKDDPSNLEYVKNVLELRDAVILSGGNDPFLPYGKKIVPTNDDIEAANRVATVLKECVDYANGDSLLFTNELYRRII